MNGGPSILPLRCESAPRYRRSRLQLCGTPFKKIFIANLTGTLRRLREQDQPSTLLVINDDNYPGTGGRDTNSDHTEFLKIRLDHRLHVDRDCHGDDDEAEAE